MSVADFIKQPVTVTPRTAGGDDGYGNPSPVEGEPFDTVCKARPVQANEKTVNVSLDETEWKVLFLPGEEVSSADRLEVTMPGGAVHVLEIRGQVGDIVNNRTQKVDHRVCRAIEVEYREV